jgi:Bacterial Ig-like domain/Leucine Rich repeats (2 copies)/Putative Ig domain
MRAIPSADRAGRAAWLRLPFALTAAVATAWAAACAPDPVDIPNADPIPTPPIEGVPPAVALSDPFAPVAGGASAAPALEVTYVSLPPGSLRSGSIVEVRNPASGFEASVPVFGGGFDPVAVPAHAGDTLRFRALDGWVGGAESSGSIVVTEWGKVVPAEAPPIVVRTYPPRGKRDVPVTLSPLVVFSEPMDTAGLDDSSIQLVLDGSPVPGSIHVAPDGLRMTLAPDAPLEPNTEYMLKIGTGLKDQDGDTLGAQGAVQFWTGDPSTRTVLAPTDACTPSSSTAVVTFADANLDAAVRTALGVRAGDDITCEQATELTSLTYDPGVYLQGPPPPTVIKSLDGIQNLTGLTRLVLPMHAVTDLGPVAALTELDSLDLTASPGMPPTISDVGPLAALTHLRYLNLNNTRGIVDLSPLSGLTALAELHVRFNSISDLRPLRGLTNLRQLNLAGNAIVDVSPLSTLTGLTFLAINYNDIADIAPLSGLTSVSGILWLLGNRITDLSPLAGMSGVTTVFASGNELTNISGLASLRNLKSIILIDNPNLSDVEPLLANASLGKGDTVTASLQNTSVSCDDVARLKAKGLRVTDTCGIAPVVEVVRDLADATVGVSYSEVLMATGGNGVYTWSFGPSDLSWSGLSFSASGVISGTPTVPGRLVFYAAVHSGGVSASRTFVVTIRAP